MKLQYKPTFTFSDETQLKLIHNDYHQNGLGHNMKLLATTVSALGESCSDCGLLLVKTKSN